MKRKLTSIFLLGILIIESMLLQACGLDNSNTTKINKDFMGLMMSKKEYDSRSEELRQLAENNESNNNFETELNITETSIFIKSITLTDTSIQITGKINKKNFDIVGDIYNSSKQNYGIDAYVVDAKDKKNNIIINYLEIKLGNEVDGYRYNEELAEKETLSMDIYDKEGYLHFIEIDMEQLGIKIDNLDIRKQADVNIDFDQYILSSRTNGIVNE